MSSLITTVAWQELKRQADSLHSRTIKQLRQEYPENLHLFQASASNIHLDYSHQRITANIVQALLKLAYQANLKQKIQDMLSGAIVNCSEARPALHTALRAPNNVEIWVENRNIITDIHNTLEQMSAISEQIRAKQWLGYSNQPITDIINIGIGGSHLGPWFCFTALRDQSLPTLNYHFIADIDPLQFKQTVAGLNPATTLFIISSKSFTTQETLQHMHSALEWIGPQQHAFRHFIAVTANPRKAQEYGMHNILPIWDWVGGRYSLCSAINLITMIAIGHVAFKALLAGAHSMDCHFRDSNFAQNLPVLLALLGIWNNNFLNINTLLLLVYANKLEYFVPHVQQLDMESNGKSRDHHGNLLDYVTAPLIWGGLGNQAQHSYAQLLCQGMHKLTADFICVDKFADQLINQLCRTKMRTLALGVDVQHDVTSCIPGNTSLNYIRLRDLSAFSIGSLVALYEHKIFVQGVIWNINSFDQPGVESMKQQHFIVS